jgi:hypothetical protein
MTLEDTGVNSLGFEVDRIIDETGSIDNKEHFFKWKGLPYCECTWEKSSSIHDKSLFNPYYQG